MIRHSFASTSFSRFSACGGTATTLRSRDTRNSQRKTWSTHICSRPLLVYNAPHLISLLLHIIRLEGGDTAYLSFSIRGPTRWTVCLTMVERVRVSRAQPYHDTPRALISISLMAVSPLRALLVVCSAGRGCVHAALTHIGNRSELTSQLGSQWSGQAPNKGQRFEHEEFERPNNAHVNAKLRLVSCLSRMQGVGNTCHH